MKQPLESDPVRRVRIKTFAESTAREVQAEYNLPDYLPDINRLLRVSAKLSDLSEYLSGDTLEYDGKLRYSLLYATSSGALQNAEFDSDFSGNLALAGASGDCDIRLEPREPDVTCRLQNPRKLTARAKIVCDVAVFCHISTVPTVSGHLSEEETRALQYAREPILCAEEAEASEHDVPVSEDLEIDAGAPPVAQIVSVELDPALRELRLTAGRASYAGDLLANVLYLADAPAEEGAPPLYVAFSRKIPISGEILSDAIDETCVASASVSTDHLEFRPQANSLGENRTVELDFDYSVFLRLYCNTPCELVRDLYSPSFESDVKSAPLAYESVLGEKTFHFSAEGRTPREDTDFDELTQASAVASVQSAEKQGGKLVFSGAATVSLILTNRAGVYLSRSFQVPFKAQTDWSAACEDFSYRADASVLSVAARLDGDAVVCNPEIQISCAVFEKHVTQMVSEGIVYREKPYPVSASSSLTLYYPSAADTLWEIAKRYRKTEAAIARANNLDGGALPHVIVIPR